MALSRVEADQSPVRLSSVGVQNVVRGVRPSLVIQAMLLMLVIANLGRIPVFSTGEREAPVLVNDLCVTCMIGAALLASLRARSLRLDLVGPPRGGVVAV